MTRTFNNKVKLFLIIIFTYSFISCNPINYWGNAKEYFSKSASSKKSTKIHSDLIEIIRKSSNKLSGTKYSVAKKTDCSGMFHQLLNTFKNDYPKYKFPNIKNARSSRDIALWYSKNGNFTIIRDIEKKSHLIQPGMVMFYGYGDPKVKYNRKKLNMQTLITRNIGINQQFSL